MIPYILLVDLLYVRTGINVYSRLTRKHIHAVLLAVPLNTNIEDIDLLAALHEIYNIISDFAIYAYEIVSMYTRRRYLSRF